MWNPFTAVAGVLGNIFGTPKAIDNLVDKDNGLLTQVGSWVGNFQYTDEERAEMNVKVRDWGLTQLQALQPFKVVQRILAFGVTSMWIFVGLNVVLAIWIDSIYGTNIKADMLTFALSDYVFWPVLAVLSLYFTGGVFPSKGGN